jgi:hypothetical protein
MKLASTLLFKLGVSALGLGLGVALLGACAGSKQPESVTPATGGGTATQPAGPGIAAEAYGAVCSDTAPCASGLSCTTYYGIAGPNGPSFQSCELKCGSDADCQAGTACVTIADGPGQVCRPKS